MSESHNGPKAFKGTSQPEYVQPHRRPKTAPKGRICVAWGCTTGLSIYNPGETCWQHTGAEVKPRWRES